MHDHMTLDPSPFHGLLYRYDVTLIKTSPLLIACFKSVSRHMLIRTDHIVPPFSFQFHIAAVLVLTCFLVITITKIHYVMTPTLVSLYFDHGLDTHIPASLVNWATI